MRQPSILFLYMTRRVPCPGRYPGPRYPHSHQSQILSLKDKSCAHSFPRYLHLGHFASMPFFCPFALLHLQANNSQHDPIRYWCPLGHPPAESIPDISFHRHLTYLLRSTRLRQTKPTCPGLLGETKTKSQSLGVGRFSFSFLLYHRAICTSYTYTSPPLVPMHEL